MPVYFVVCARVRDSGVRIRLLESHRSLPEALCAFLEHQQRPWQCVALTPYWPPARQLTFFA